MIINFFNSNFFASLITSIVTLIVGLVALLVYKQQKKDLKQDAANIILLEIQSAERAIKRIEENIVKGELSSDIFLMPSESWTKFKYLFLRNFDRDEWDDITDFYNKCQAIDNVIKDNNSAFWSDVEEIRSNKQRILANYAKKSTDEIINSPDDESKTIEKYKEIADKFDNLFMERQGRFAYSPQKLVNDAKRHLLGLSRNLSQTIVGTKLKEIAKL